MGLQTCGKCGRFHYVPGPCPASKSTAARKDVPDGNAETPDDPLDTTAVGIAGTQAPPVHLPKRPRGRPRTGFDKKAYDRDYRARQRKKEKIAP